MSLHAEARRNDEPKEVAGHFGAEVRRNDVQHLVVKRRKARRASYEEIENLPIPMALSHCWM
jgi:hypothetical protein